MAGAITTSSRLTELLKELQGSGVSLSASGGKLRVSAPTGAVTAELREQLALYKEELLRLLTAPPPLSFAQERLWTLYQTDPDAISYHVPLYWRLRGPLDVEALRRSVESIIARHEPLRTRFQVMEGSVVQDVQPPEPLALPVLDFEGVALDEVRWQLDPAARTPFDLTRENPLRVRLVRLAEQEHVLLFCVHHIVFDGWSVAVLQQELAAGYNAWSNGRAPELQALPVSYGEYARAERASGADERALAYWRKRLDGATAVEMPLDRPRPARVSARGAREPIVVPAELARMLEGLGRGERATVFMVLLAAWRTLLECYSGQYDVCVGTLVANRTRRELEPLIGFFANTLVIRSDSSDDPAFVELIGRVRDAVLEAQEHQSAPVHRVLEDAGALHGPGETPLVSNVFVLQNAPVGGVRLSGLEATIHEPDLQTAKFDLSVSLEPFEGELRGYLEYRTDLFEAATARRLVKHYLTLLGAVASNPRQRVREISLLRPAEREMVLAGWNQTQRPYPDVAVHRLFEEQAARTPNAVALLADSEQITYGELNARANRLARYLQQRGVGPEVAVGLCLHRSAELITAMLAVLKAGGAYVPLDPEYPAERLELLAREADVALVLTEESLRDVGEESAENLPGTAGLDQLAYVMYTSGSTGRPKGVEIPHRGIVRLLFGTEFARFGPEEVFLHLAPPSFDAATLEVWGALLHGGTCVIAPAGAIGFAELGALIREHGVTTLWLTASLFHAVIDQAPEILKPVRQLLAGGEALSAAHVRRALTALPGTRLINGYGPTENTTFTCCYPIPAEGLGDRYSVPIGRPIANTRVYVLDERQRPAPVGVPGELYIGGDGLARGYRGDPQLTAEKFVPDPLGGAGRLYRSGDRVRYRDDGTIEFLGRLDHQVKLRGHRIELGEVEAAVIRAGARAAGAVVRRDERSGDQLLAFYVPAAEKRESAEELRAALSRSVPGYLIPGRLIEVEALPQLANGKLDRKALAKLAVPDSTAKQPRPLDETEAKVAAIMAEVLRVDSVDGDDDFFACGGHSLLGMKLVARLEETFGGRIPAGTLLKASTPRALAQVLKVSGNTLAGECLVPMQPEGKGPPVFFLHSMDGDLLLYRPLITHLRPRQPVYGVMVTPLENDLPGMRSVEQLAARYLREIRRTQPRGPYRLCGYSFGGVLAFEIARQLEAAGESVEPLIILDTATYMLQIDWSLRERGALLGKWLGYRLGTVREGGLRELGSYMAHKVTHAFTREPLVLGWVEPERHRLASELLRLLENYQPQPIRGRAVLFRAAERSNSVELDPRNGWEKLALGGVEVIETAGDHLTFIKEPHARAVAEAIDRLLLCV